MRTVCLTAALAGMWLTGGIQSMAADAEKASTPPEIMVTRCPAAPVIDGKLDDACWKDSPALDQFYIFKDEQGRTTNTTKVMLLCDDQWLYLGLTCANPEMKKMVQKVFNKEGAIHTDDSVELFVDPGTDGKTYYHYLLSFANMRGERQVTEKGSDAGWDTPWRSATLRGDDGWTAEIALPLFVLASYGHPEAVRMNICRNMMQLTLDGVGEKTALKRINSSLARVQRGFHEPKAFAFVHGLDKIAVKSPFLPALDQAAVGDYEGSEGAYSYGIKATVRAFTPQAGQVAVVARDRPLESAARGETNIVSLEGMKHQEVSIKMPVAAMGQRAVSVAIVDVKTGEILQEMGVADVGRLTPMSEPILDRNYYTTEKEARIRCRVGFPDDMVKGMNLVIRGAGKELGRHPLKAGSYTHLRRRRWAR